MQTSRPRRIWLAALAALVTATGVSGVLEALGFALANILSASSGALPEWTGNPYSSGAMGSLVLITIRTLSFGCAGFVGAWFGPSRPRPVLLVLLGVALLSTVFEQLPPSHTAAWFVSWSIAAPLAISLGAALLWWRERGA